MIKKTIILVYVIIPMLVISCHSDRNNNSLEEVIINVTVQPVQKTTVTEQAQFYGSVHLRQESYIGTQFDGRLSNFSLLPGDEVVAEQHIGEIIPSAREALLHTLNSMPAHVAKSIKNQINIIPLLSPVNGVVLKVIHHTGDILQKGDPIVHIADLDNLDIYGELPVHLITSVKPKTMIKVDFINASFNPLMLPIESIAGEVAKEKQSVMLRLKLPNPDRLYRPGMLTKLFFPTITAKDALTVPIKALVEEEGGYFLFIVNNNHVKKQKVQTGIFDGDIVQITDGVKEGNRVVVDKAYSLKDGMKVEVQ